MSYDPYVSVIIPTRNSEKNIKECLNAILLNDYPKNRYEIIVVDAKSGDNTANIISSLPVNLVQMNENRCRPSPARNIGAKVAKGEILLFVDSDVVVEQNWLKELIQPFQDPNVAGAGGFNYQYHQSNGGFSKYFGLVLYDLTRELEGGSIAFRKEVYNKLGGQKEHLRTGEDLEFRLRALQRGYKIVKCKSAKGWHKQRSDLFAFTKQYFGQGLNVREAYKGTIPLKIAYHLLYFPIFVVFLFLVMLYFGGNFCLHYVNFFSLSLYGTATLLIFPVLRYGYIMLRLDEVKLLSFKINCFKKILIGTFLNSFKLLVTSIAMLVTETRKPNAHCTHE